MTHVAHVLSRTGKSGMVGAALACGLAASMPAGASIMLQPFNPPVVSNSAVEVQAEAETGNTIVFGPQSGTGSINQAFTTSVQIPNQTVSSSATSGVTSASGQGQLKMGATISSNTIQGSGSLSSTGTLVQGPAGNPSLDTDGAADFDIFFTLTAAEEAKIDLSSSISTSQKDPNNQSVVFLLDQSDNDIIARTASQGNQSQTASYDGLLMPGDYLLRGLTSYEDSATISDNNGTRYYDSGVFSFDLVVTPASEPSTTSLLILGMGVLGALALRRRRSVAAAR